MSPWMAPAGPAAAAGAGSAGGAAGGGGKASWGHEAESGNKSTFPTYGPPMGCGLHSTRHLAYLSKGCHGQFQIPKEDQTWPGNLCLPKVYPRCQTRLHRVSLCKHGRSSSQPAGANPTLLMPGKSLQCCPTCQGARDSQTIAQSATTCRGSLGLARTRPEHRSTLGSAPAGNGVDNG